LAAFSTGLDGTQVIWRALEPSVELDQLIAAKIKVDKQRAFYVSCVLIDPLRNDDILTVLKC
jgi:hypothetical protein